MTLKTAMFAAGAMSLAACAAQRGEGSGLSQQTASACQSKAVEIYFDDQQDQLSDAADAALQLDVASALACRVVAVRVVGLADAVTGTPESNQAVSQRRADRVTARIAALGVPDRLITKEARGEQGAMANSIERPLRRRTHIEFELSNPK